MARNRSVQFTHHVTHVGKKNHPTESCWQGAGAHLRPKRTQTEQKDTNASNSGGKLKQQATQWLLIQANPIPKRPIQKTNFPSTPTTWLDVGQTKRHFGSEKYSGTKI